MSISSIPASTPAPINYPDPSTTKTPDVKPDGDANDAGAAQPPVQAALPPGQGTRVNQLV
jgi:hypothetical protein